MSARLFQPARRLALQLACAALLGACARPRRRGPDGDDPRDQPEKPGYLAEAPYREESFHDVWRTGDEELALEWLLPRDAAQAPLVIYLPGLGEPAGAGLAWRRAWARAGGQRPRAQADRRTEHGLSGCPAARSGARPSLADPRGGGVDRRRRRIAQQVNRGGRQSLPPGGPQARGCADCSQPAERQELPARSGWRPAPASEARQGESISISAHVR